MKRSYIALSILLLVLILNDKTLDSYAGQEEWIATREIVVLVLSVRTNEPIANALVRLSPRGYSSFPHSLDNQRIIETTTDDSGWATLQAVFVGGGDYLHGLEWALHGWLEIEHANYENAADWIGNYTDREAYRINENGDVYVVYKAKTRRVEVVVLLKG